MFERHESIPGASNDDSRIYLSTIPRENSRFVGSQWRNHCPVSPGFVTILMNFAIESDHPHAAEKK
jgi:hypothetical protein